MQYISQYIYDLLRRIIITYILDQIKQRFNVRLFLWSATCAHVLAWTRAVAAGSA